MPPDQPNNEAILSPDELDKSKHLLELPRKSSIMKDEKTPKQSQHGSDGRDAWFTLLLVFLVNVLLGLNWIAFSVFYIYFAESFEAARSITGWIGSIQVGATNMFGK